MIEDTNCRAYFFIKKKEVKNIKHTPNKNLKRVFENKSEHMKGMDQCTGPSAHCLRTLFIRTVTQPVLLACYVFVRKTAFFWTYSVCLDLIINALKRKVPIFSQFALSKQHADSYIT